MIRIATLDGVTYPVGPNESISRVRLVVADEVVGREREQRLVISALAAGRDLLSAVRG